MAERERLTAKEALAILNEIDGILEEGRELLAQARALSEQARELTVKAGDLHDTARMRQQRVSNAIIDYGA